LYHEFPLEQIFLTRTGDYIEFTFSLLSANEPIA